MSRDITKLQPFTRMLADELVRRCAKDGLKIKITDCVRTKEEQNSIGSSRTKCRFPYSYHNWGMAFDFCRNDGQGAYNESGNFFYRVGEIGSKLGLEWGGLWTNPVDKPHFQLNCFTDGINQSSLMVKQFILPDRFFKNELYTYGTPKLAITPKSKAVRIMWLQTRLTVHGFTTDIDGIWGEKTAKAVRMFWRKATGSECTGYVVKPKCIKLLKANPK